MGAKQWFYHPVHGGHIFDLDSPPNTDLGWHTTRDFSRLEEIPQEWQCSLDEALAVAPKSEKQIMREAKRSESPELANPADFEDFDSYMNDFVDRLIVSDRAPGDAEVQKKLAIAHYANVQYAIGVNRKRTVERLAADVREHEERSRK